MRLVKFALMCLCVDEAGATAIEYALIASLISISILTAAATMGGKLSSIFDQVSSAF